MAVSVGKLIHRGEARYAARDRIALEDALHTTLPDDGRLVLVRRLQVHGEVADPARRQDAVRRGWVAAVSGAVHGGAAAATRANCVWFASREEAEALLLRKLLAGEPVDGWFWPLAVRDWGRLSLSDWLPRVVAACLAGKDSVRLARIAETFVQSGHVARLVAAVERALPAAPVSPAGSDRLSTHAASPSETSPPSPSEEEAVAARMAVQLAARVLPPAWHELLDGFERSAMPEAATERVIAAILEERIRRASPALSLRSRMVRLIVAAMRDMSGRTPVEPELPTASDFDPRAPNQRDPATAFHRGTESLAAGRDDRSGPPRTEPGAQPSDDRAPQPGPLAEPAQLPRPSASRHAGLWLILPSLVRLGFGEWLAARTELLGDDPARSLILAVATHHRVALDDPALVPFAPFAIDETVPAWTEAWRIGLDRWLRRTARRRTHDLAARPGKVLLGEHRVDIHFPLDAADLRLRRLALDRDPGWVAWLGLAVRYHFGAGAVP